MLALLVKPTVWKSRKGKRIVSDLISHGALVLQGTNALDLRTELQQLHHEHLDLVVVACGGDGTVHLALNSLPNHDISLAVIPLGTGNDFARYLKIKNPESGLEILHSGSWRQIDFGLIETPDGNEHKFLGVASCGFDAQVNERANTYRGPSGTLKYLVALFVELSKMSVCAFDVAPKSSAKFSEKLTLVAVGNTSSYGGGMKICPTANASDGQFEITYVAQVTRRLLVRVLPKVFWGGHVKHRKVRQDSDSGIALGGESFPVYADGERVGVGPIKVMLIPGGVRVWQAQATTTP